MLSSISATTINPPRQNNIPLIQSVKKNRNVTSLRIYARQAALLAEPPSPHKTQNPTARLAESLLNFVHLHFDAPTNNSSYALQDRDTVDRRHKLADPETPILSPKEDISTKWNEIHTSDRYENLLSPLQPWLRREIVKYGEFAQATYDAFDFDSFSEYCGSCRYNRRKLFEKLGLGKNGYEITKYIYAMSHVDVPRWLERSHLVDTSWSKDSNWMGYIAVSDNEETKRLGRRDIVVAWRGTVAPTEWFEDLQNKLEPIDGSGVEVKVEHGFRHIYTSKSETTRYNKLSASQQVMNEVKRLVKLYREKGEAVSLTITGHSLGGALALLNAYEAAETIPGLPISVISFGAPRVGNVAFRDKLHMMGVRTLRVVVKQDLVPKAPGIMLNESIKKFEEITGNLDWVYTHVGAEMKVDVRSSPYLKRKFDLLGFHSLETYLHLVDGFVSSESSFREHAKRDVALVNKACGMLVDELRIPENWYQLEHKGLVKNPYGRWVKPTRDSEDVPSLHHIHETASPPCLD